MIKIKWTEHLIHIDNSSPYPILFKWLCLSFGIPISQRMTVLLIIYPAKGNYFLCFHNSQSLLCENSVGIISLVQYLPSPFGQYLKKKKKRKRSGGRTHSNKFGAITKPDLFIQNIFETAAITSFCFFLPISFLFSKLLKNILSYY